MKNKIIATAFAMFIILATSCKKEDDSAATPTNSGISGIITSGTWKISYFHEGSSDHTADFNGYTFTFSSGGSMTSIHASDTTVGTWRTDDSNVNEFHMSIGNSAPLHDLSKGWLLTSQSSSEIRMTDNSGSSSEELRFVKL